MFLVGWWRLLALTGDWKPGGGFFPTQVNFWAAVWLQGRWRGENHLVAEEGSMFLAQCWLEKGKRDSCIVGFQSSKERAGQLCIWSREKWAAYTCQICEVLQGGPPLENIIYRSDRLPTLILMMGIWDNRSQVGVFLCQQSIQHGNSLTLHTRHGRHKEMACLQETQLVWSWRHISFLQPAGEATGADLEITSNVLNVSMVPTC